MRRVMLLVLLASALPMAALADSITGPFYAGTAQVVLPGEGTYSAVVTPADLGHCTVEQFPPNGCLPTAVFFDGFAYTVRCCSTEIDASTDEVNVIALFEDHGLVVFGANVVNGTITQHGDIVELFGDLVRNPDFDDYVPPGSFVSMDLTEVPEPGTLVLLGTGVIGLLAAMARRRFKLGRHVPIGNCY